MESERKYQVFIVHPEKGTLVTQEKWAAEPDPSVAQCVAVVDMDTYRGLVIYKQHIKNPDEKRGRYEFDAAQQAAALFHVDSLPGLVFRNPTVRDTFRLFDARYQGLDEALELIDGSPMVGKSCWTCEEDPHPDAIGNFAHNYMSWTVGSVSKDSPMDVRPVADLQITGKAKEEDKEDYVVMIVDPDSGSLVTLAQWKDSPTPERARLVALVNRQTGDVLVLSKELDLNPLDPANGWYDFDDAQEAAEEFEDPGFPDLRFRNATREEANIIYRKRFSAYDSLDEALALVGGDGIEEYTCWTCEPNPAPDGGLTAFCYSGSNREINIEKMTLTISVRPVARVSQKDFPAN